jgi:REP element-mobilizing transposase RayT
LATIIRSFKSAATKRINTLRDNPGAPVWQRNYYERVIRDDRELHGIRQYIADNPAKWEMDENHPARQTPIL